MNRPQLFRIVVDEDFLRVVETNQCRRQLKGVPLSYEGGVLSVLDIEGHIPIELCEDQLNDADVAKLLEVMNVESWHRSVAIFEARDGHLRLTEARRMTESELEKIKHALDVMESRRNRSRSH